MNSSSQLNFLSSAALKIETLLWMRRNQNPADQQWYVAGLNISCAPAGSVVHCCAVARGGWVNTTKLVISAPLSLPQHWLLESTLSVLRLSCYLFLSGESPTLIGHQSRLNLLSAPYKGDFFSDFELTQCALCALMCVFRVASQCTMCTLGSFFLLVVIPFNIYWSLLAWSRGK